MKGSRVLPCVTSVTGSLPLPGGPAAAGPCSGPMPAPQCEHPKLPPPGTHRGGASMQGWRGKSWPVPSSCSLGVPGGTGDLGA